MDCFFYKFQSIERDEEFNLHTYAPDKKYMTVTELVENGEWMDHLIDTYGNGLTREKIAKQCKMYACTDEDKILTVPYYSLFEDKYVYMPVGFAEHMYSANGCCVGNTRAEAWVHALSEIMERKGNIDMLVSGQAAPEVPESALQSFPTVQKILQKIRTYKNLDIKVFDFSDGLGIPVICTRIINKDTQRYIINTGADPVLEIAVERTLTEILQGKNIERITATGNAMILNSISDYPVAHNVLNLLETGNGTFAADFFAEEAACNRTCTKFADNSGKTNEELLSAVLAYYKTLNKPVYIRNYSFLNFQCYKFIVPGFSESRGFRLNESVQEYALADIAAKVLKQPLKAKTDELSILLMFYKMIQTARSRRGDFGRLAGIPMGYELGASFLLPTLSYAAYKLGDFAKAISYIDLFLKNNNTDDKRKKQFACVKMYLQLKSGNTDEGKIRIIINKFFDKETVQNFYESISGGKTPYDSYLLDCDPARCASCPHNTECSYTTCKEVIRATGKIYSEFADGQNRVNFSF